MVTDITHYLHRHQHYQHYQHHVIWSGQILINSRSNNDRVERQVLIAIILYDFRETKIQYCQMQQYQSHGVNIKSIIFIDKNWKKLLNIPKNGVLEYLNPKDLIYLWQFIK